MLPVPAACPARLPSRRCHPPQPSGPPPDRWAPEPAVLPALACPLSPRARHLFTFPHHPPGRAASGLPGVTAPCPRAVTCQASALRPGWPVSSGGIAGFCARVAHLASPRGSRAQIESGRSEGPLPCTCGPPAPPPARQPAWRGLGRSCRAQVCR